MAAHEPTPTDPLNGGAPSDEGSITEDDRSSSLSEIEDDEQDELELENSQGVQGGEADSEAETERLEPSPHTPGRHTNALGAAPFEKSPSKLAHAMSADDQEKREEEQYSSSEMSSPLASVEGLADNDNEELESDVEGSESEAELSDTGHGTKRKRNESEETTDPLDTGVKPLHKRTGSVKGGVASGTVSDDESGEDELEPMDVSRESTPERAESPERLDPEDVVDDEQLDADAGLKNGSIDNTRPARSAKLAQATGGEEEADDIDNAEAENVSEDERAADEADEAEAERKNEEEFAKKMVAMDSLVELEKQFAILRDKLYAERIGEINQQLLQLDGPNPTNAEYLEKMQHVLKHRDNKHDYEHKLLAFKIQSLKTNSVAGRSQIHTAYYQTVRDIRERYLDLANDQFYKIQRDRFKPDEVMPSYSVPFPEKRSQQITQQASYNKEVSILAGVAKYVGFPAAPEIATAKKNEIEDDFEKMGLPSQPVRVAAAPTATSLRRQYSSAAEEQFIEQTPWANPQHPIHKNRQISDQQHAISLYATPANQKTTMDLNVTNGSASTIPETLSAQASSALNTPHDQYAHQASADRSMHRVASNGYSQRTSLSPTDTRKVSSIAQYKPEKPKVMEDGPGPAIHSPPQSRNLYNSPFRQDESSRAPSTQHDPLGRHQDSSPLTPLHTGIAAGSGHGRFSVR